LESFLIEITAEVLGHVDQETGLPLVDVIADQAGSKGTGVWTVQSALDLGIPVTGIAEAVFARAISGQTIQREVATSLEGPVATEPVEDVVEYVENIRLALYASKIVAYSQGFDAIAQGAIEHSWSIDRGAVAKIWRAGCIIQARFLNQISDAYEENPELPLLVASPIFSTALNRASMAWRKVIADAVTRGIPTPAFSSSLAYYDQIRRKRLPAALIQGQRDFFGAHTYRRVVKPGVFHTKWSADRSEEKISD